MKHSLLPILFVLLAITSCKTVKKTQQIQEAITKKDTVQTILIKQTPNVDSSAIVREILDKTLHNKIDFTTFNAKIKVDYAGPEQSDKYTAYVSMKKDSIILIKITGSFLGISAVGLEAKIKKDSVVVAQLVGQKSVTYRSISYLQEMTQLPFDFYTLQDLIIGNPVFADSNLVSYKAGPTQLLVLVVGDVFKHLLTLDNNGYKVLHSKLDDVNAQRNRTGDITFGEYKPMGPFQFSTYRKISVAEKSKLDITLDFKEYGLNEPLKYHFDIPKNLKRL
jgi:hypothetical protein